MLPARLASRLPTAREAMTDYVLTGLIKRRAALAGEIEATHARLRASDSVRASLDRRKC